MLDDALVRGDVSRGDAPRLTGRKERAARQVVGQLIDVELMGSETPKGSVSLRFPDKARDVLFPRLFLEA